MSLTRIRERVADDRVYLSASCPSNRDEVATEDETEDDVNRRSFDPGTHGKRKEEETEDNDRREQLASHRIYRRR